MVENWIEVQQRIFRQDIECFTKWKEFTRSWEARIWNLYVNEEMTKKLAGGKGC